jgi:hypothetical protein
VQWYQFSDSESSWEVESEVTASDLVERFWKHVGYPREQFNGGQILSTDRFIGERHGFKINKMD